MVVIGIKNSGCDFISIPYFFVRFKIYKHLILKKNNNIISSTQKIQKQNTTFYTTTQISYTTFY